MTNSLMVIQQPKQIQLKNPESMPILERCKANLMATLATLQSHGKIDRWTKLLPEKILQDLHWEIISRMTPAKKSELIVWSTALIKAYSSRSTVDTEFYIESMSFDLSEFPEDIVIQTVHEVRRSCKFLPTCSEVYQHASGLLRQRQAILDVVNRQLDEHKRRRQEAAQPEPRGWKEATQEERSALTELLEKTVKALRSDDSISY